MGAGEQYGYRKAGEANTSRGTAVDLGEHNKARADWHGREIRQNENGGGEARESRTAASASKCRILARMRRRPQRLSVLVALVAACCDASPAMRAAIGHSDRASSSASVPHTVQALVDEASQVMGVPFTDDVASWMALEPTAEDPLRVLHVVLPPERAAVLDVLTYTAVQTTIHTLCPQRVLMYLPHGSLAPSPGQSWLHRLLTRGTVRRPRQPARV